MVTLHTDMEATAAVIMPDTEPMVGGMDVTVIMVATMVIPTTEVILRGMLEVLDIQEDGAAMNGINEIYFLVLRGLFKYGNKSQKEEKGKL